MKDRLIVALDVSEMKKARELINLLDSEVNYFKVGLELFLNTKGEILDYLKNKDKKVFLDLKFHDIPNTVSQAARWATASGADMFNVHASGGEVMLARTVEMVKEEAVRQGIKAPLVIGVTVLTSFDDETFSALGMKNTIPKTVINWARMCRNAGLDGVVSSAREAGAIKEACSKSFLTVCPGVRPAWSEKQDQKRIMTPAEAVSIGADYIVVGRPILQNENPAIAAEKIIKEMEERK